MEALRRPRRRRHVRVPARRARARALHRHRRRFRARSDPGGPRLPEQPMTQLEMDRLYDQLAELIDRTPPAERERTLARLVIGLAQELGDYGKITGTIRALTPISKSGSEPD